MTHVDFIKPYNQILPLFPEEDFESSAILKKCATVRTALAELKQADDLIN